MPATVAIAGLGTIGMKVAEALHMGIGDMELVAVSSGRNEKAVARLTDGGIDVPVVENSALAEAAEIIVECAPAAAFKVIATPALEAGRTLLTVSGAALLDAPELVTLAEKTGGKIILATGALLGLDAVRAAAEGDVREVRMVTKKPPRSLEGAPYLVENNINVMAVDEAKMIFKGTAREAARGFPANLNVGAALSLAGNGPDATYIEIWADPAIDRNTHTIFVDADTVRFSMTIENVPSEENPGTGQVTPLSVIAALRGMAEPLKIGT
ncbi:MAG: aspartate dehydrogenase [Pseudomonadota bacterium]|nr:aspartate dehydrogenase [Pseudomonadota bacterium]